MRSDYTMVGRGDDNKDRHLLQVCCNQEELREKNDALIQVLYKSGCIGH